MMRWPWTKQQEEAAEHCVCESRGARNLNCPCGHSWMSGICVRQGCPRMARLQHSVDGNQNPTPDATKGPGDVPEHQHKYVDVRDFVIWQGRQDFSGKCRDCGERIIYSLKYLGSLAELLTPQPQPEAPPALQQTGVERERERERVALRNRTATGRRDLWLYRWAASTRGLLEAGHHQLPYPVPARV